MTSPKYLVNISYYPQHISGQQPLLIGGVTQSIPTYDGGYFVASMPEVRIAATGSSYANALTALLSLASSTDTPSQPPLTDTRTW
jgi:hypothetical protein